MKSVLIILIRGYQRLISPIMPPSCRFYPTCSQYTVIAIERHGAIRGGYLAAWRIIRCGPWSKGGIDEVPLSRNAHHEHFHTAKNSK